MGYTTNPRIAELIAGFGTTEAAKPKAPSDAFWSQYYDRLSTPGAALDTPFTTGAVMRAGAGGRAVNEGAGIDPHLAAAGGGEQWALVNAEKNAARNRVGAAEGADVGRSTAAASGEGGQYELGRARQTDQFNIGKYGAMGHALAGGSTYKTSPWLGLLQGIVGGAASNLHFGGGGEPDGTMSYSPDDMFPGGGGGGGGWGPGGVNA